MYSVHVDRVLLCRVSPFGNLRIKAHLRLPVAYRSLSRPSSALSAKAFPLRPLQLDQLLADIFSISRIIRVISVLLAMGIFYPRSTVNLRLSFRFALSKVSAIHSVLPAFLPSHSKMLSRSFIRILRTKHPLVVRSFDRIPVSYTHLRAHET